MDFILKISTRDLKPIVFKKIEESKDRVYRTDNIEEIRGLIDELDKTIKKEHHDWNMAIMLDMITTALMNEEELRIQSLYHCSKSVEDALLRLSKFGIDFKYLGETVTDFKMSMGESKGKKLKVKEYLLRKRPAIID